VCGGGGVGGGVLGPESSDFPFFCTVGCAEAILIFHDCTDNSRARKEELSMSMLGRYVGREVTVHSFLTSEADGCDWYTSRPCRFAPGQEAQYPLHKRLLGFHNKSALI
jgi:hypothetical protein